MTEEQEVRQITVPKNAAVVIFTEEWCKLDLPENHKHSDTAIQLASHAAAIAMMAVFRDKVLTQSDKEKEKNNEQDT